MAEKATNPPLAFKWNGKRYEFKLNMRDIETLEDAFELPLDQINLFRTKAVMYMIVFGTARHGEQVSLERLRDMEPDALFEQFEWELEDEDEDPTSAVEDGGAVVSERKTSGKRSSAKASTSGN